MLIYLSKMKCIVCDEEAMYMYLGNSYCKKHKDEHMEDVRKTVELLTGRKSETSDAPS